MVPQGSQSILILDCKETFCQVLLKHGDIGNTEQTESQEAKLCMIQFHDDFQKFSQLNWN